MIFIPHRARARDRRPLKIGSLRGVILAMTGGLFALSVVLGYVGLNLNRPSDPSMLPILGGVLIVAVVAMVPAFILVRRVTIAGLARRSHGDGKPDAEQLETAFCQLRLIGAALAESVGLFGAIICVVTGEWYTLAAVAPAILVMAAQIPTQTQLEQFAREITSGGVR